MFDIASQADHAVSRLVVALQVGQQSFSIQGTNAFLRTDNVTSQGVIRPDQLIYQDVNPIIGCIKDHVDFLDNHPAFFFDLLRVEPGAKEHVHQNI